MNKKTESLVPFGYFADPADWVYTKAARFINGPFKRGYHQANSNLTKAFQKAKQNLTLRNIAIIGIVSILALLTLSGRVVKERATQEEIVAEAIEEPQAEAVIPPAPKDDYQDEAETLAKLLYGYQYNSDADLRGICWCVINRCESSKFPSTIQDVCRQNQQWMGYSDSNPVLEDLYQLALTELRLWHQDGHRPVGGDFVFMSWTTEGITLRTTFEETVKTHYWRPEG